MGPSGINQTATAASVWTAELGTQPQHYRDADVLSSSRKQQHEKPVTIFYFIIVIIFLTPVLNSQGMKKLCYAIQKSTKITLE